MYANGKTPTGSVVAMIVRKPDSEEGLVEWVEKEFMDEIYPTKDYIGSTMTAVAAGQPIPFGSTFEYQGVFWLTLSSEDDRPPKGRGIIAATLTPAPGVGPAVVPPNAGGRATKLIGLVVCVPGGKTYRIGRARMFRVPRGVPS